jgi:hypothetical protein
MTEENDKQIKNVLIWIGVVVVSYIVVSLLIS